MPVWVAPTGRAAMARLTPHHAAEEICAAHAEQPHGPVSMAKAWKEMVHRYLASALGLLILVIAVLAVRDRARLRQSPLLAHPHLLWWCASRARWAPGR